MVQSNYVLQRDIYPVSIQTPNASRLHDLRVTWHPPSDKIIPDIILPNLTSPLKAHFTEDVTAEGHSRRHAGEAARVV